MSVEDPVGLAAKLLDVYMSTLDFTEYRRWHIVQGIVVYIRAFRSACRYRDPYDQSFDGNLRGPTPNLLLGQKPFYLVLCPYILFDKCAIKSPVTGDSTALAALNSFCKSHSSFKCQELLISKFKPSPTKQPISTSKLAQSSSTPPHPLPSPLKHYSSLQNTSHTR